MLLKKTKSNTCRPDAKHEAGRQLSWAGASVSHLPPKSLPYPHGLQSSVEGWRPELGIPGLSPEHYVTLPGQLTNLRYRTMRKKDVVHRTWLCVWIVGALQDLKRAENGWVWHEGKCRGLTGSPGGPGFPSLPCLPSSPWKTNSNCLLGQGRLQKRKDGHKGTPCTALCEVAASSSISSTWVSPRPLELDVWKHRPFCHCIMISVIYVQQPPLCPPCGPFWWVSWKGVYIRKKK